MWPLICVKRIKSIEQFMEVWIKIHYSIFMRCICRQYLLVVFKSMRPTYVCRGLGTWSSLVQVIACRLFGAMPSPESKKAYCQSDCRERVQWNYIWRSSTFISIHAFKKSPAKWRTFCAFWYQSITWTSVDISPMVLLSFIFTGSAQNINP